MNENKTEREFVYIHSLKLADILVNAGYKCEGKKLNIQNPKFFDFIFKNEEGIWDIIYAYTKERHQNQEN